MLLQFSEYRIRDLAPTDAPAIARHADNPRIADVMRDLFPSPYALSDAEEFITRITSAELETAFAIANNKNFIECYLLAGIRLNFRYPQSVAFFNPELHTSRFNYRIH